MTDEEPAFVPTPQYELDVLCKHCRRRFGEHTMGRRACKNGSGDVFEAREERDWSEK